MPDLQHAYDTASDYDPRDAGESIARPDTANEKHGTRVAGVIAGSIDNDIGTIGGALGGTITATYLRFGGYFQMGELDEIIAHQQNFDVSNNSWGFTQAFADNFKSSSFDPVEAALEAGAANGRGGRGTVFVFAAGNGKNEIGGVNIGDDSNYHNLQNSRFTIAVGAHDINGAITYFSSPGTNVLLTALWRAHDRWAWRRRRPVHHGCRYVLRGPDRGERGRAHARAKSVSRLSRRAGDPGAERHLPA